MGPIIYYSSLVYYGNLCLVAIANFETEKIYKYKQDFMTIFGNIQFHALCNILLENPWKMLVEYILTILIKYARNFQRVLFDERFGLRNN